MVCGGTDVNEFADDPVLRGEMRRYIDQCHAVVSFSAWFCHAIRSRWPIESCRVHVIPQGVDSSAHGARVDCMSQVLSEAKGMAAPESRRSAARVALWPGGLRSVKDPVFATQGWSHIPENGCLLLLIGPPLEDLVAQQVEIVCMSSPRILWHHGVPHEQLMALFADRRTCCVLNTSRSEGQPQCILEAMAAGVPVVARDIPANAELLGTNGERGLLVRSSDELCSACAAPRDECRITAAKHHVQVLHSMSRERSAYRTLAETLLADH